MNKSAIVSLATKNSLYVDGLARLSNSLRDTATGIDFLGFIHERSVGAPLHTEMPYAFKVHAIRTAIDMGYTQILWLDCSVWAVAPVEPIFDTIGEVGYWFEGAGFWLEDWCTDETFEYFGLERQKGIKMIQSGFMGFDINSISGGRLWNNFIAACYNGIFAGSWDNYRHDQTAISCILHRYNVNYSHLPERVQYNDGEVLNDKIIFKCVGL